jgi:hypothetical protein
MHETQGFKDPDMNTHTYGDSQLNYLMTSGCVYVSCIYNGLYTIDIHICVCKTQTVDASSNRFDRLNSFKPLIFNIWIFKQAVMSELSFNNRAVFSYLPANIKVRLNIWMVESVWIDSNVQNIGYVMSVLELLETSEGLIECAMLECNAWVFEMPV